MVSTSLDMLPRAYNTKGLRPLRLRLALMFADQLAEWLVGAQVGTVGAPVIRLRGYLGLRVVEDRLMR